MFDCLLKPIKVSQWDIRARQSAISTVMRVLEMKRVTSGSFDLFTSKWIKVDRVLLNTLNAHLTV